MPYRHLASNRSYSIAYNCCSTLVVSAIHVGVAFAASASSAGKLGSQEMSGGKTSRGGIAKNSELALQLLGSPAFGLDWIGLERDSRRERGVVRLIGLAADFMLEIDLAG